MQATTILCVWLLGTQDEMLVLDQIHPNLFFATSTPRRQRYTTADEQPHRIRIRTLTLALVNDLRDQLCYEIIPFVRDLLLGRNRDPREWRMRPGLFAARTHDSWVRIT